MATLSELQNAIQSGDPQEATAAGKALTDFYDVYNREYNALVTAKENASAELLRVNHNPDGIDTPYVLQLQGLIYANQSRIYLLDEKMLAFYNSGLEIAPPSSTVVSQVKDLSEKVTRIQMKADATSEILGLFTQVAQLTAQVYRV
jgi:hypothetical protein